MSLVEQQIVRRRLIQRLIRNGGSVGGLILAALGIGAVGYHLLDGLSWLDATLNAAMILTGMGPVSPITSHSAKVFAIVYSLFSGVFFLSMVAVLLAPALHHFMHRLHLELNERESRQSGAIRRQGGRQTRDRRDGVFFAVDRVVVNRLIRSSNAWISCRARSAAGWCQPGAPQSRRRAGDGAGRTSPA